MASLKLYGMKDCFDFGQYQDETVEDILEIDPGYVLWCINNVDTFNPTKEVKKETMECWADGECNGPSDGYMEVDYDHDDPFIWEDFQNY